VAEITIRAPAIGAVVPASVTVPWSVPRAGVAQDGNLNEPILVRQQRGEVPVHPASGAVYSVVYQNVHSSTGSTASIE
jgi:hypothetical protein